MSNAEEGHSTALAPIEPPSDDAVAQIRRSGKKAVALTREANKYSKMIAGMEWGSVKGSTFSRETQYALAEFCVVTKASPVLHIDILGGKPYLNAQYWSDRLNTEMLFHHYEQRELSQEAEDAKRTQAKSLREIADQLDAAGQTQEAAERRAQAMEADLEADQIAVDRAFWSPPDKVTSIVETTIYRFVNSAPIEKIRSGEITDIEPYLITVKECNWAGNQQKDPVGNEHPSKTARTRSLRRCSVRAFSAWMEEYSHQIQKAEEAIDAEWEVVSSEPYVPQGDEPKAIGSGNGEAEVMRIDDAKDLPVYGEEPQAEDSMAPEPEEAPASTEAPEPVAEKDDFDRNDARKKLFATLRDAGMTDDKARKEWAKRHDLPESTKNWTKSDYNRAIGILMGPWVEKVEEGCKAAGENLSDLSLQILQKESPEYLKDYQALAAYLDEALEEEVEV